MRSEYVKIVYKMSKKSKVTGHSLPMTPRKSVKPVKSIKSAVGKPNGFPFSFFFFFFFFFLMFGTASGDKGEVSRE